MATQLSYTSGPGGYSSNTSGTSPVPSAYGGNADVMAFFKEMARRRLMGYGAPQPAAMVAAAPEAEERERGPAGTGVGGSNRVETPWYSYQGAAMVPMGGPGIVPGLRIEQTKLPPEMRAQAAGFVGSRSRVPTGTVESPDMDAAAASAQNTNVDPYELIRRRNLNAGYGR